MHPEIFPCFNNILLKIIQNTPKTCSGIVYVRITTLENYTINYNCLNHAILQDGIQERNPTPINYRKSAKTIRQ